MPGIYIHFVDVNQKLIVSISAKQSTSTIQYAPAEMSAVKTNPKEDTLVVSIDLPGIYVFN